MTYTQRSRFIHRASGKRTDNDSVANGNRAGGTGPFAKCSTWVRSLAIMTAAIACCLAIAPAAWASVDEFQYIYVGGTASNGTTYSLNFAQESACEVDLGEGTVGWDPETCTLTLNGVDISQPVTSYQNYGIYAQAIDTKSPTLTIVLKGENTISGTMQHAVYTYAPNPGRTSCSLAVSGDGSLSSETCTRGLNVDTGSVSVSDCQLSFLNAQYGIRGSSADLQNITLNVVGKPLDMGSELRMTGEAVNCGGPISVKDSTVTASKLAHGLYSSTSSVTISHSSIQGTDIRSGNPAGVICSYGPIQISDGSSIVGVGVDEGIHAGGTDRAGTVTISDSTVSAQGTTDDPGKSGISAQGDMVVTDSTITVGNAQHGIYVNPGAFTLNSGDVYASGITENGIFAAQDATISGKVHLDVEGFAIYAESIINTDTSVLDITNGIMTGGALIVVDGNLYRTGPQWQGTATTGSAVLAEYRASSTTPTLDQITYGNRPYVITGVGAGAFNTEAGHQVTSVVLGPNVNTIEAGAFAGCSALESIYIPKPTKTNGSMMEFSIGEGAFDGCTSLAHVFYAGSKSDKTHIAIGTGNDCLLDAVWHYKCSDTTMQIPLSKCTVTLSDSSFTFDGTAKTPTVTVTDSDGNLLKEHIDYTVTYIDNTNIGTAKVVVSGVGAFYLGSVEQSFTIENATETEHSWSEWTVTDKPTCDKTGTEERTCSSCGATESREVQALGHDWSEWTQTKPPTYTEDGEEQRICSACNITETRTVPKLVRTPLSADDITLSTATYTYNGKAKTPTVTVEVGGNTLVKDTDYDVDYSNNVYAGTGKVTVTGKGDYTGTVSKDITIKPLNIASSAAAAKMTLSTTAYQYNGKAKKPAVTVTATVGGTSKTLMGGRTASGTAINLTYASGRTKVGTYKVTATGTGNYTGTITKTFKVNPAKANMKSIATYGKGTLKWTATSKPTTKGGSYYQVQYRKQGTSTYKYSTSSKTYYGKVGGGKLTKGKKYYVRVRAVYKTSSGSTYYGAWSTAKLSPAVK